MYYDRFDIVQGHYFYCMQWNNGISCPLYARLSKIMGIYNYKPSINSQNFSSLTENGKEIYYNLVKKGEK